MQETTTQPIFTHTVWLNGGSVDEINSAIARGSRYDRVNGRHIDNFISQEAAQEYTKRNNKLLTKGEKTYYRLRYHVKPYIARDSEPLP